VRQHVDRTPIGQGTRAIRYTTRFAAALLAALFSPWLQAALTAQEAASELAAFNQVRSNVALGSVSGQPSAANMARLVWDADLAAVAQSWTDQCVFAHNPNRTSAYASRTGATGPVGENLYASSGTRAGALSGSVPAWASEVVNYNYAANTCANGQVCGHYTQVVWATTLRVGCGITFCPTMPFSNAQVITCDFYPAGNFVGQRPYVAGTPGSACPPGLPQVVAGLCSPAAVSINIPLLPPAGLVLLFAALAVIGARLRRRRAA